jgi:hypothetical protein
MQNQNERTNESKDHIFLYFNHSENNNQESM